MAGTDPVSHADPVAPPGAEGSPARLPALEAARGLALVLVTCFHCGAHAKADICCERYAARFVPVSHSLALLVPSFLVNAGPVLFWLLVGVSAGLVGTRGGHAREIDRRMLVRLPLLIALDQTLVSWSWMPNVPFHLVPQYEILTCLAIGAALLVPLRRLPGVLVALLAVAIGLGYPAIVHGVPQARLEALPWWLKGWVAFDFVHPPVVMYPILGWLVLALVGLLVGRAMAAGRWRGSRPWLGLSLAVFAVWILSGLTGYGDYGANAPLSDPLHWLVLSKGPPGLGYMGVHLATGALAIAALFSSGVRWDWAPARWLRLLGQVALFLFLLHLAVAFAVGRVMLHLVHHAEALRYALTCAGTLVVLTVLGLGYRALKRRYPRSVLQYL